PVEVVLLDVRQDVGRPAVDPVRVRVVQRGREPTLGVVETVQGQAELLEVVAALQACGRLADLLDGGQEQADEDGYDRYHHQKLDQGEGLPSGGCALPHGGPRPGGKWARGDQRSSKGGRSFRPRLTVAFSPDVFGLA